MSDLSKQLSDKEAIVIGFGPAGMFASLELLEKGFRPVVFERGKPVEERLKDIELFVRNGLLNPESNIQFGEGGAGAYSDGKLFSRVNNSKYVKKVFDTFVKFGAPEGIMNASKPHLGTDVLCGIVKNIRNYIIKNGGEINYNSKVSDLLISNSEIIGVMVNENNEILGTKIYIAIGHSARDTFQIIYEKGVTLEQKPISVGVRIEHPVEIINKIKKSDSSEAAFYSFTYTDRKLKRGVYSFCMCPGGEVVNASSQQGCFVSNGMSYSKRNSPYSNSALVVTCHTDDYKSDKPLGGIEFQKDIEQKAYSLSNNKWEAPAQNLLDFINGTKSAVLNKSSYKMGLCSANFKNIFPDFVTDTLLCAFAEWRKNYPLFVSNHGMLLGAETRTSCPVRIKRRENYESENTCNLYPVGEGAGYAGGIVSSAVDAIKAVENSITKEKKA